MESFDDQIHFVYDMNLFCTYFTAYKRDVQTMFVMIMPTYSRIEIAFFLKKFSFPSLKV